MDEVSLFEVIEEMFPTEAASEAWFEEQRWSGEPFCAHCGSVKVSRPANHPNQPYRCGDCGKHFSARTGTALSASKLTYRKWAVAIFLFVSSPKGIASTQLAKKIGVQQRTAWFMLQRLRKGWQGRNVKMKGPVEADEAYMGGSTSNMHSRERERARQLPERGKTPVLGVYDRATKRVRACVEPEVNAQTVQHFLLRNTDPSAVVYTDESRLYTGLGRARETVNHSRGEYVRGEVTTNAVEGFWATLKRAHKGVFHKMSPKHLSRYLDEFTGRQSVRHLGSVPRMELFSRALLRNKTRLPYHVLIARNGLRSGARPRR